MSDALLMHDVALVEVLDRVIDKGVVLRGDLTIAIADIDLIYVGLQVLLCSLARLKSSPPSDG